MSAKTIPCRGSVGCTGDRYHADNERPQLWDGGKEEGNRGLSMTRASIVRCEAFPQDSETPNPSARKMVAASPRGAQRSGPADPRRKRQHRNQTTQASRVPSAAFSAPTRTACPPHRTSACTFQGAVSVFAFVPSFCAFASSSSSVMRAEAPGRAGRSKTPCTRLNTTVPPRGLCELHLISCATLLLERR